MLMSCHAGTVQQLLKQHGSSKKHAQALTTSDMVTARILGAFWQQATMMTSTTAAVAAAFSTHAKGMLVPCPTSLLCVVASASASAYQCRLAPHGVYQTSSMHDTHTFHDMHTMHIH